MPGFKQRIFAYTARFTQNTGHARSIEKKNIASLEGMRAFAALGVVTLHITYLIGHSIVDEYHYPWLSFFWVFGNTGVQLFFVLSGFLLFMPYARALLFQEKWPSTRSFYFRRVLRILPGYYFSLFLLVVLVQHVYLHPDHWGQLFLFLTFFMDSSKTTFQQINVPYWSLATEVQFYLLLPLVSLGIYALVRRTARTPRRRYLMAILACLGLVLYGLAARYIGLQFAQQPQSGSGFPDSLATGAQFFFFGVRGKYWEDFAIGMLVSLCFTYAQHPEYGRVLRDIFKKISLYVGLSAVVWLTFCAMWYFRATYFVPQFDFMLPFTPYQPWLLDFCASVGWGLLIAAILFGSSVFKAPFEWRPMRLLGMISYAIYIWHLPMLTVFRKDIFPHLSVTNIALSHALYWAFFALVIVPWCTLVYWFVERPFMRIKDRQKRLGTTGETKETGQEGVKQQEQVFASSLKVLPD